MSIREYGAKMDEYLIGIQAIHIGTKPTINISIDNEIA